MKNIIPYGKQKIFNSDLLEVKKALKSNLITTGIYVTKFENLFCKYTKAKYSTSCTSGTAAIHLALESLGVKKNDNIIIPSVNFIAAANLSSKLGANIYLADVDKNSGQMTPEDLINCIKFNKLKKIKVFFSMYNGGSPNHAKEFYKIKKKYKTIHIEDACHALGAKYLNTKNSKVGSCKFSDMATFSFHPLKSITTGEGGMITTSDKFLYEKIKKLKNHGIIRKKSNNKNYNWSYEVLEPGYNYRLSDINCALGFSQLKKIDSIILKRKLIAKYYNKKLKNFSYFLQTPEMLNNQTSAWHLYIINIDFNKLKIKKKTFINELYKKKIITQVHYIPTFLQPAFKKLKTPNLKGAIKYYESSISLPIFYDLNWKKLDYIVNSIEYLLNKYKK
tara:strand:+ start:1427 stop:2599 length:1173 start_codon:yes stop_codon:yes gene_type:complete